MTHDTALVKRAERFYTLSELRKSYTKRGRFERRFLRADTFENAEKDSRMSDGGKGAAAIRELGRLPEFVYLVRYEVERLRGDDSKVARAVMRYDTLEQAREKLGFSGRRFYGILKNLKPRFTQCFQAYGEYLRLP